MGIRRLLRRWLSLENKKGEEVVSPRPSKEDMDALLIKKAYENFSNLVANSVLISLFEDGLLPENAMELWLANHMVVVKRLDELTPQYLKSHFPTVDITKNFGIFVPLAIHSHAMVVPGVQKNPSPDDPSNGPKSKFRLLPGGNDEDKGGNDEGPVQ